MIAKDTMSKKVHCLTTTHTAQDAALMMKEFSCGIMPVEKNEKLIGMVTDRDLAIRIVTGDKTPKSVTIEDCMSKGVNYCYEDDTLESVGKIMSKTKNRRLPVLNKKKQLVGIISLGDLFTHMEKDNSVTHQTMRAICA